MSVDVEGIYWGADLRFPRYQVIHGRTISGRVFIFRQKWRKVFLEPKPKDGSKRKFKWVAVFKIPSAITRLVSNPLIINVSLLLGALFLSKFT